jgi:chromosome segregation ATPase
MRRAVDVLSQRAGRHRRKLEKQCAVLDDLYARIGRIQREIGDLKRQARNSAYDGEHRRETLMRALAKRAVLLYSIAQREAALAELIAQFDDTQRDIEGSRQMLSAHERRRDRHGDRLAKAVGRRRLAEEMDVEQDYLDRVAHAFNQRR